MTDSIGYRPAVINACGARLFGRQADWTRKTIAYAIAVAVNLALIGAVLFSRPPSNIETTHERAVVDVSIIAGVQAPAPDSEASNAAVAPSAGAATGAVRSEREADVRETLSEPQRAARAEIPPDLAAESRNLTARDDAATSVALAPSGDALPGANTQTRSTLRSLACAQRLGRDTSSLSCGDAAADFSWAPHLNAQATAEVEHQVSAHLSSLGGLFGFRYPGEMPTGAYRAGPMVLAAPSRNLAASDSMRDRLPPMAPDPAFGD
jgi:hypothetical protein